MLPDSTLATRSEYKEAVCQAITHGRGFAAGKIGVSEKHWLFYPLLRARGTMPAQRWAFEMALKFHCLKQSGVFPVNLDFYAQFGVFFAEQMRQLDYLGLFREPDAADLEADIVRSYQVPGSLIHYRGLEPDRSAPADDAACYLPCLKGKRLLLVCPFADLLRQRAQADLFEAVWAKTGKRWFQPASVAAIEFPYGFEPTTWARYPTVYDLMAEIKAAMAVQEFDVALIAAGGMGISLAVYAKGLGKVGISLGGVLQILFGVLGKRWRDYASWQTRYFTEAWIDMPERYKPRATGVCDDGAYW